jgi:hypothetical protein
MHAGLRRGGDDVGTGSSRVRNRCGQCRFVISFARSQAEIDEPRALSHRPADRRNERHRRSRQLAIKDFDRQNFGIRRFLADDGGHRRAVTETVDVIRVLTAFGIDADAARDALHMRMRSVHAAVDHRDANTAAGGREIRKT